MESLYQTREYIIVDHHHHHHHHSNTLHNTEGCSRIMQHIVEEWRHFGKLTAVSSSLVSFLPLPLSLFYFPLSSPLV